MPVWWPPNSVFTEQARYTRCSGRLSQLSQVTSLISNLASMISSSGVFPAWVGYVHVPNKKGFVLLKFVQTTLFL